MVSFFSSAPLLMPDEVRRLSPDQVILIRERQNPLLVNRIVYFQNPTFQKIFEAQSGPLPYPSRESAMQGLAERVEQLERQIAGMKVVDFVRPEGRSAEKPASPEPKLAKAIVEALDGVSSRTAQAFASSDAPVSAPVPDLLTPAQEIAVARMNMFTRKLAGFDP